MLAPGPTAAFAERRTPAQRRQRPTGPKVVPIVAFLACGIPRRRMRYRWRTTVYRMQRWRINILPRFRLAFGAPCTDRYLTRRLEHRMVGRQGPYLLRYLGLPGRIPWLA